MLAPSRHLLMKLLLEPRSNHEMVIFFWLVRMDLKQARLVRLEKKLEMPSEPANQSGLRFVSGIIDQSKVLRFERMLFRATRGNMLFNQAPVDEQVLDHVSTEMSLTTCNILGGFYWLRRTINEFLDFMNKTDSAYQLTMLVEKTVFVVFFYGEQAKAKTLKICEAFDANCYLVPEEPTKQRQLTREVVSRLSELDATLDAGIRH